MNEAMNDTFIIQDLDTLKVISDPLRNQILEALILEPLTVNQVAEKLGMTASKLYYHVNLLEKHGLIQVVETRTVSNLIEKVYRAVATRFTLDHDLLSFETPSGQETIYTAVASTLDSTREDVLRSFQARAFNLEQGAEAQLRRAIFNRALSRLTEEKVQDFQNRLNDLVADFEEADMQEAGENQDLQSYALTVVFYPSFYYPNAEK